MLYTMKPTPIVALNRAVAIGNARGPGQGLAELANLPDPGALEDYPFYPAAQGEFHLRAGRPNEAAKHFEHARKLARTQPEKDFFDRKLNACRLT
jgi:predicted RNA polymerase sigma factor